MTEASRYVAPIMTEMGCDCSMVSECSSTIGTDLSLDLVAVDVRAVGGGLAREHLKPVEKRLIW